MLPAIQLGPLIGWRYSTRPNQALGHASLPARSGAGAAYIWAEVGAVRIVDFAALRRAALSFK